MTATDHAIALTRVAARAASDKLGDDLVAFDVSEALAITDVFLIVSASNDRQVGAIVDAVEEALLAQGTKPARREGHGENRWVLLDFIDVVVHVMHAEERALYALERLWRDCPPIALDEAETDLAGATAGTPRVDS
ncbi:ribosome silencing factor [Micropruina sp.]|uniref:ribosome silencing factor n=1 Tax=Micropruina sp. TaxID=2737536 RepID=UPI002637F6B2|nr:ribosome silencing factor [Micropruina sp.]